MKKAALLILLVSSAVWTSCSLASKEDSSDVDQSKIEVDFRVTFTEDSSKGNASASFTVDEKGKKLMQLKLDEKSNVTVNGHEMAGSPIPIVGGFSYFTKNIPFQEQTTFIYTNNIGKVYKNVLYASAITTSEPVSDSIGGWIMPVSRGPMDGEVMWIFMHGDKDIESGTIDIQTEDPDANGYYDEDAGVIYFIPDVETDFPKSDVVSLLLISELKNEKIEQAPAAGGTSTVRYETKEYKINIK